MRHSWSRGLSVLDRAGTWETVDHCPSCPSMPRSQFPTEVKGRNTDRFGRSHPFVHPCCDLRLKQRVVRLGYEVVLMTRTHRNKVPGSKTIYILTSWLQCYILSLTPERPSDSDSVRPLLIVGQLLYSRGFIAPFCRTCGDLSVGARRRRGRIHLPGRSCYSSICGASCSLALLLLRLRSLTPCK